ncbi:reverse transcriptase domain-containing protein [Sphingobacterium detergens]|uniref:Reverse transcriptase (RNA-dependent DNA polymerase) n=1 Tax=Sphingobacterium detergens TaxID=1145106 RepID=A0A420BGV7_SPHD1|nr:reverse transcriptase domain-containing protein [Sphingobacterium detergens]RKE55906.1 reverse transcriptase (RNA-dependent DNA polymerase) [Sphingobacterium detergens]
MKSKTNNWLKNRGYLHVTNQLNISKDRNKLLSLIKNKDFVSSYAFFPLIHSIIKERRYKQNPYKEKGFKCHSFKDGEKKKLNAKKRPLHYATHMDAAIFSYYSELILVEYENYLKKYPALSESITAYRRIPKPDGIKNKSTINFAHDAFMEIQKRALKEDCIVLKFDIKSFFNEIDHFLLKKQWAEILGLDMLPTDHYNVFKGVTRFSYIMKDSFRVGEKYKGRRPGFNEKKLSQHRKNKIHSFFESPKEFREAIRNNDIKIHKFPFRKDGVPCGFPQGLPISSTLANLYLLKFDEAIIENIVVKLNGYYRRYSDDIIVLTTNEYSAQVEQFVINEIKKYKVKISEEKTERFIFRKHLNKGEVRVESIKLNEDDSLSCNIPLTYLGFEFYGYKTLVKSANLAKFYRRLISSVKTKTKRAQQSLEKNPTNQYAIYRNQLFRLYARYPLSAGSLKTRRKSWGSNSMGEYYFQSQITPAEHSSNYLSYINRASEEMNEPALLKQIKRHKTILHTAIYKHRLKN